MWSSTHVSARLPTELSYNLADWAALVPAWASSEDSFRWPVRTGPSVGHNGGDCGLLGRGDGEPLRWRGGSGWGNLGLLAGPVGGCDLGGKMAEAQRIQSTEVQIEAPMT